MILRGIIHNQFFPFNHSQLHILKTHFSSHYCLPYSDAPTTTEYYYYFHLKAVFQVNLGQLALLRNRTIKASLLPGCEIRLNY